MHKSHCPRDGAAWQRSICLPAMSFTHTIIRPTDFSEPSARAFELACALARQQGARLIVTLLAAAELLGGPSLLRGLQRAKFLA
jgi:hypothetical protein